MRGARELEGGLLYVLYLCNQRDMLMLFFSFSVSGVLRLGWEGEGDRGERGAEFGPIWVPGKLLALSSHLNGEDSDRRGKCTPTPLFPG